MHRLHNARNPLVQPTMAGAPSVGMEMSLKRGIFTRMFDLTISLIYYYYSYLSSIIAVIWSNASESLNRLQVTQKKAACIVLNCSCRTTVSNMLNKLNWLPVKNRLHFSLVSFVRNIMKTKSPVSLFRNLMSSQDRHKYFTRQTSEKRFLLPVYGTGAGQRTLYFRAMVAWLMKLAR